MVSYKKMSVVREELPVQWEDIKVHDKHAVAVVKDDSIVGNRMYLILVHVCGGTMPLS